MLTTDQQRRYARHIVLPQIGEAGQAKLAAAKILLVGAGGLGANCLMSLAASGVGTLGIVEPDRVELSNLQRQTLYETADIGRPKAGAAADRLNELNPDTTIHIHETRLDETNAAKLVAPYDLIIDGTDNYPTRFVLNDACMAAKKPWLYTAMVGFDAQMSLFNSYLGAPMPCYRCLVPELPERERSCAQEGIIGPLAGMMGSLQALEAIKEILSIGESLAGKLLVVDALSMHIKKIHLPKDDACKFCA